jgi:hypothetical protein
MDTEPATAPKVKADEANVVVMARVRPFNRKELEAHNETVAQWSDDDPRDRSIQSVILMEGKIVHLLDPEKNYAEREAFEFDHAFWSIPESQNVPSPNPIAVQEDVFNATGKVGVENAIGGYNCCIFAYGQTGSGKTHSMLGCESDPGISPRLVKLLFDTIEASKTRGDRTQFSVELSFLEIYNEKVKDLLALADAKDSKHRRKSVGDGHDHDDLVPSPSAAMDKEKKADKKGGSTDAGYTEVRVRFHPEKGTFVEGLKRLKIEKMEQCLEIIKTGMEHRAVAATLMNDTSSRSHAIFQICIAQKNPLKGTTRVSIVNLVDLAGSERIRMSGVTGTAFTEATNINQSLSTLRRVIDTLIDNSKLKKGQRPQIAPYRESLLTWVLSDSLGGNSKTMMLATISPAASNFEDTLNTLRYALKAKAIVCHAKVNEEKTAAVVHAMRAEMEELRRQLNDKVGSDTAESDRLKQELQTKEEEFVQMQEEGKKLEELKVQYEQELASKDKDLQRAQQQMAELEGVEEEKVKKSEELDKARKLQEETEDRLKKEEEERRRKEDELSFQLARKESLRRKHDAAIEEESRARVATETAKIRNFAAAFNNAFLIRKQRSDYEELRTEYNGLRDKISSMEMEIVQRESEMQQLQNDRVYLQRKIESQEKRYDTLSRDFTDVVESKAEKISQLMQQKDLADSELGKAQGELARRMEELTRLQRVVEAESVQGRSKTDQLRDQLEAVLADKARKEARRAQLTEELAQLTQSYETLVQESSAYDAKIHRLRTSNTERAVQLKDLERRHEELLQQVSDTRRAVEERELERTKVQELVQRMTEDVGAITRSHEDLKQFVSQRFFPTGKRVGHVNKDLAAAQLPQGSATPGRVWAHAGYRYAGGARYGGTSPARGIAPPGVPTVTTSVSPRRGGTHARSVSPRGPTQGLRKY